MLLGALLRVFQASDQISGQTVDVFEIEAAGADEADVAAAIVQPNRPNVGPPFDIMADLLSHVGLALDNDRKMPPGVDRDGEDILPFRDEILELGHNLRRNRAVA